MTKKFNYEMAFTLAIAEATQSQLRARYYEQRVVTGAYKEKLGKVKWGTGIDLTEEELRQSDLGIMHNHIQLAQDHLDHAKACMAEAEAKEERAPKAHPYKNVDLAKEWWCAQSDADILGLWEEVGSPGRN